MFAPLLVCLPARDGGYASLAAVEAAVTEVLAPYDRARTSPTPQRVYQTGHPRHYSYTRVLVETGHLDPQRAARHDLTWAEILAAEERFDPHGQLTDDRLRLDDNTGQIYRTTTANPQGRCSEWTIGGNGHPALATLPGGPAIDTCGPNQCTAKHPGATDITTAARLDPGAVDSTAAIEARRDYDAAASAAHRTPSAEPLSAFTARHDADSDGYSLDDALADYTRQARYQALADTALAACGDPIAILTAGRAAHIHNRTGIAVFIGHDLVDTDGAWRHPPVPPLSDCPLDRVVLAEHRASLAAHLRGLPGDTLIVAVEFRT